MAQTLYAVFHCARHVNSHAGQAAPIWVGVAMGGCLLGIAALTAWFLRKKHDGPDDSGWSGGSGGPPSPEPPPPGEPSWWPEFEREFAAHVAGKHENEQHPAPVQSGASPNRRGAAGAPPD